MYVEVCTIYPYIVQEPRETENTAPPFRKLGHLHALKPINIALVTPLFENRPCIIKFAEWYKT